MNTSHCLGEGSERTAGGTIDRPRPHPAPGRSVRGALWRAVLGAAAALGALVLAAAPARAGIAAKPAATWQTNGRVIAILDLSGITYVGGKFSRVFGPLRAHGGRREPRRVRHGGEPRRRLNL